VPRPVKRRTVDQVGPLSPRHRIRRLDRRTREGQFLETTERDLYAYLGGKTHVTVPQRLLVERVAADLLRIRMYDDRIMAGELLTDHDGRILNALRNSVRLTLQAIGIDKPEKTETRSPAFADVVAEIVAKRDSAA
jgi:hypothetical protein